MSILVDDKTRLLVSGMTGTEGMFHTQRSIEYGTRVVAGITPGRGDTFELGIPIYNTVLSAVHETRANASMIFVPAAYAADSIMESIDAGIPLIICITEGIPIKDMVIVHEHLKNKASRLIGPNCAGVISPGKCRAGIMAGEIHLPGNVGVVSRSGTLTYETVAQLTARGIGQSTCVGIGGDPLPGSTFVDILKLFQEDKETEAVVLIGEIGGTMEQDAAVYIKENISKPVVAFIAGTTAPPGKRMGHAGAIVSGSSGTAHDKIAALAAVGVTIAKSPAEIGLTMKKVLGK